MNALPVLIVGAGPTGLVLALWLTHLGVRVRIVDKVAEPGTTSRALAVQARTLEFYQQIGLADAVVDAGFKVGGINLWSGGVAAAHVPIGELGRGLSPFPFPLIYPQDAHERLLIDRLRERGVTVERPVEVTAITQRIDVTSAVLRHPDGREEHVDAGFVAGCDGAHSIARRSQGIEFSGGTYAGLFYVADVEARGSAANGELHVELEEADFLAVFPLDARGRLRLVGVVSRLPEATGEHLGFADVSRRAIHNLGLTIDRVNWFSTYRVHHRVASRFRNGRVFLLGDAAHVHSPVGGQGMNTGIGDAVNLAWKLAAVVDGRAPESLLDSYEPERIRFARRLVATTDRVFTFVIKTGPVARRVRTRIVPRLAPLLTSTSAVRELLFRTVSQIGIEYRDSAISRGLAGRVHGGDRLPWIQEADNFAPLRSMVWQAHVYGEADAELGTACEVSGIPLHQFPWRSSMADAGVERDALYLIRPDGHVGLADGGGDPDRLRRYLARLGLRPAATVPSDEPFADGNPQAG